MNRVSRLDRMIEAVAPGWAAARARARAQTLAYRHAYDAVQQTHLREQQRDMGSGNAIVSMTGVALRNHARYLDRNHDIVSGGLSTLVQNMIGASGINVVPTPRDADGNVVEEVVDQIMPIYQAWAKRPEVTGMYDWAAAQRLLARTWVRDGEALLQELIGAVPYLEHGSAVPYSLELMEPDLVPLDFDDAARRIAQGIEVNAWGRPIAYHVYMRHPGDADVLIPETKRVPASVIRHVRNANRINQRRGESVLASTFTRLEDLKDYEESERIAAKVAASMAAAIIKGDAQSYTPESVPRGPDGKPLKRSLRMQPGMIFDQLLPGERVELIDSKRPNPNLEPYRDGQLRAVASPFRVSYSSLSKNYNGTYSAQRQELVEQHGAYGVLAAEMIAAIQRPVYERLVATAVISGEIALPRGVTLASAVGADYLAPPMPWINPVHEAIALRTQVRAGFRSLSSVIAERGGRMYDVIEQLALERGWARERAVVLDSDPAQTSAAGVAQADQAGAPKETPEETQ